MKTPFYNWKIYLDTCCLSRPFNDQTQTRIRRETEAIEKILKNFSTGDWSWIVSGTLTLEVDNNRDVRQRDEMKSQITNAYVNVLISEIEIARGRDIEKLGFKRLDALHLACAESGNADVFLTTDDRLLRRAKRLSFKLYVRVENPYEWLQTGDN